MIQNITSPKILIIVLAMLFTACKKDNKDIISLKPYNPTVNFRIKSLSQTQGIQVRKIIYTYNNELIDSIKGSISTDGITFSDKVIYSSGNVTLKNIYGYSINLIFDDENNLIQYDEMSVLPMKYTFTYQKKSIKEITQYVNNLMLYKFSVQSTNNQPIVLEGYNYGDKDSTYEKTNFIYENGLIKETIKSIKTQGVLVNYDGYTYYYSNGLLTSREYIFANSILMNKECFEYDSNGLLKKYLFINYNNNSTDTIRNYNYEYEEGKGNMRDFINPYDKLMGLPFPI